MSEARIVLDRAERNNMRGLAWDFLMISDRGSAYEEELNRLSALSMATVDGLLKYRSLGTLEYNISSRMECAKIISLDKRERKYSFSIGKSFTKDMSSCLRDAAKDMLEYYTLSVRLRLPPSELRSRLEFLVSQRASYNLYCRELCEHLIGKDKAMEAEAIKRDLRLSIYVDDDIKRLDNVSGPRSIDGYGLANVGVGVDSFFKAVALQLQVRGYAVNATGGREMWDYIKSRTLSSNDSRISHVGVEGYHSFVHSFTDVVLAVISTRKPADGYLYVYWDNNAETVVEAYRRPGTASTTGTVARVADAGDVYLAVTSEPRQRSRTNR